jgi:hypothetical protein
MRFIALLRLFVCTRQVAGLTEIRLDAMPGGAGASVTLFLETMRIEFGLPRKASESAGQALNERVQPPSQGFDGRLNPLAPSAKKSLLGLRQKIFRPPAPLVAILPQGLMVLPEVGKQGFQGVEFGLDDAQAREERRVWFSLGRCRTVRHEGTMAHKGYRSAKFRRSGGLTDRALVGAKVFEVQGRCFQHS